MPRSGLAEQRALMEEFPSHPDYRMEWLRISSWMARLLLGLNRLDEVEYGVRSALSLADSLSEELRCRPAALEVFSSLFEVASAVFAALGKETETREFRVAHLDWQARALLWNEDASLQREVATAIGIQIQDEGSSRRGDGNEPEHGGKLASGVGARLRWKAREGSVAYRVHLGPDPGQLEFIARVDARERCEVRLPELASCRWYAWRVDAVAADGSVMQGPVWAFSTGGLLARWTFDEVHAGRVRDSSGLGRHGELVGGARVVEDPERGGVLCLGIAYDRYVDCGSDPIFNVNNGFTIAAWVRRRPVLVPQVFSVLVEKGTTGWRFLMDRDNRLALHGSGLRTTSYVFRRSHALGVGGRIQVGPHETFRAQPRHE